MTAIEQVDSGLTMLQAFKGMATVVGCTHADVDRYENLLIDSEFNLVKQLNAFFLEHKLVDGMYCRKLFIPRGMFLTGKVHKKPYIDMCVSGDITLKSFLHDGSVEASQRVKGFSFFEGKPGRKRIGFAHEDTVWMTIDHTNASHIEDAEDDICVDKLSIYVKEFNT